MNKEASINILHEKKALIIDDHKNIRSSLRIILESKGAHVDEAADISEVEDKILNKDKIGYDLVFLDIQLPSGSGLELLGKVENPDQATKFIVISGEATSQEAFKATNLGAFDFVEKPFTSEKIIATANRCLDYQHVKEINTTLSQKKKGPQIMGTSEKIQETYQFIKKVSKIDCRVLILGESGTGKELLAKAIHDHSHRDQHKMLKINCAAIPTNLIESELFGYEKGAFTGAIKSHKGVFERAHRGTLFLDEIGELQPEIQAKLLRVLQNGEINKIGSTKTIEVDVRLLAATNRNLEEMVKKGLFREDLYYRLNVVSHKLPSLEERKEDIPLLSKIFLREVCQKHDLEPLEISSVALDQLKDRKWPGNIRELKNYVEKIAILSPQRKIDKLPQEKTAVKVEKRPEDSNKIIGNDDQFWFNCEPLAWSNFHTQVQKLYIKHILKLSNGNVTKASQTLKIERAYLHRLMKKLDIRKDIKLT